MTDPSASAHRRTKRAVVGRSAALRGSVTSRSKNRAAEHASPPHDPEKRWRLINAAADAFSRHGFERAGVDEIAAAAEVAKGTVYLYFNDKADLFLAVLAELPNRLQLDSDGPEELAPESMIRKFIRTHLQVAQESPELFRCYLSALFGVNRDFQGAALGVFAMQRRIVERSLGRISGGPTGARAIEHRASLFVSAILAGALIEHLDPGMKRARQDEEAFMALLLEPAP